MTDTMFFFTGEENKHEYGVGFLVHHKDMVSAVLGCRPSPADLPESASEQLLLLMSPSYRFMHQLLDMMTMRLTTLSISNYRKTFTKLLKKDILIVQGDMNAKDGRDAQADREAECGPYCNAETN